MHFLLAPDGKVKVARAFRAQDAAGPHKACKPHVTGVAETAITIQRRHARIRRLRDKVVGIRFTPRAIALNLAHHEKHFITATARRISMKPHLMTKAAALASIFVTALAGTLIGSHRAGAQGDDDHDASFSRIRQGFDIAPVELDLQGKNPALVGLGSYLVNAVGACNVCHTAGGGMQFAPGGNPFQGQEKKYNLATYLAGGRDMGTLPGGGAHIISRNLTPDKTGRPAGGLTFPEFVQIMRTGVDLDQLHPTCSGAITPSCVPPPADGQLLQLMPWFAFQDMSDEDLRAMYEYLSAIPCNPGPPAPSPLHNDCG
jgi:mono/diheme cytochrome c family protein